MRVSIIKKMLAGTLAVVLLTGSAMSVQASTNPNESTIVDEAAAEAGVTAEEIPATSSVAGTVTTVTGVYLASKVNGTAITTPAADIAAGYGLASNEKAFAKFSNMDAKKSYLANACLVAGAASQNAILGPCVNIELGKMTSGHYSLLPTTGAAIRISIGIPASFAQDGHTYAMVRVREGGIIDILKDVDANPNTITFDTTGGAGAYAIIKY